MNHGRACATALVLVLGALCSCAPAPGPHQALRTPGATAVGIASPSPTVVVERTDIVTTLRLDGRLTAEVIAVVTAPISGVVRHGEFGVGDMVGGRDVVVEIEPPPEARVAALELEAARLAVRLIELESDGSPTGELAARQRLIAAESAATAVGISADAPLPLQNAIVRVPTEGVIVALAPGEHAVGAGDVLVELGSNGSLAVRAPIEHSVAEVVRPGDAARVALRNGSGAAVLGTVRAVSPGAVATTATISVPAGSFDPGARVAVEIDGPRADQVLSLAPAALRSWNGRDYVIVRHADGSMRRADVVIGLRGDDRVEIRSGVEADEIVVLP